MRYFFKEIKVKSSWREMEENGEIGTGSTPHEGWDLLKFYLRKKDPQYQALRALFRVITFCLLVIILLAFFTTIKLSQIYFNASDTSSTSSTHHLSRNSFDTTKNILSLTIHSPSLSSSSSSPSSSISSSLSSSLSSYESHSSLSSPLSDSLDSSHFSSIEKNVLTSTGESNIIENDVQRKGHDLETRQHLNGSTYPHQQHLVSEGDDPTQDGGCEIYSVPEEERCHRTLSHFECKHIPLIVRFCLFNAYHMPLWFQFMLRIIWYILLFLFFVLLVISLADTSDSYFSPSLIQLTEYLRMPSSIAGVTLLAIGNNAPDLFSIIVGTINNSESVSIGAPVGGSMFITCCVFGSVLLFSPKVIASRRPFIRDLFFYMIAIFYTAYLYLMRRVYIYESVVCFIVYGIYVVTVFVGRLINLRLKQVKKNRLKKQQQEDEKQEDEKGDTEMKENEDSKISGTPSENESTGGQYPRSQSSKEMIPKENKNESSDSSKHIITSSANENDEIFGRKIEEKATPTSPSDGQKKINNNGKMIDSKVSESAKKEDEEEEIEEGDVDLDEILSEEAKRDILGTNDVIYSKATGVIRRAKKGEGNDDNESEEEGEAKKGSSRMRKLWRYLSKSVGWREMRWYHKIKFILLDAVCTLIRNLTIPKVGEQSWNKWFTGLSMIFGPQLALAAAGRLVTTDYHTYFVFPFPAMIPGALAAIGVVLCTLIFAIAPRDEPRPFFNFFVSLYSCFMSIIWIYLLADFTVGCIESFGEETGFPPTILTITFLALGNNIGDLIADVIVSRSGYPQMAVGAVFGGSLMNVLVGLGIAFTFGRGQNRKGLCYIIEPDSVITLSIFFLVCSLLMSLFMVPLCKFRPKKPFALILFTLYAIYISMSIVSVFVPQVQEFLKFRQVGLGC